MLHESETAERMSWSEMLKSASGTEADRRNQYRFLAWMAAWGISFVGGTSLTNIDGIGVWKWVAATVSALLGLATVAAYVKFLRESDELTRKIQMEGISFAFGVGIVLTVTYQMFQWAGAPVLELSTVATVMLVSFAFGQMNALRRYR